MLPIRRTVFWLITIVVVTTVAQAPNAIRVTLEEQTLESLKDGGLQYYSSTLTLGSEPNSRRTTSQIDPHQPTVLVGRFSN